MTIMDEDRYARGRLTPLPAGVFSLRLPILFFVSLAMIALSRLDHPAIKELRAEAEAIVVPALGALMLPLDPARRLVRQVQSSYDGFAELERLEHENRRLRQWESRARDLERKIGELAALSKAVEQHRIDYRTVRVIATANGAFLNSALLEAGTEHGIRVGQPVLNAHGLLGRIVEAGRRTSRVLLLSDINSRVPVAIGRRQVRAILVGDNSAEPRLLHLPVDANVTVGEQILTTGLGGMFPRGLRIGVTGISTRGLRASLDTSLGELEYVSVLLYENPGVALASELRPAPADQRPRPRNGSGGGPRQ
jgi:rod shape-determining protein MreC